jgi:hypothetical protein
MTQQTSHTIHSRWLQTITFKDFQSQPLLNQIPADWENADSIPIQNPNFPDRLQNSNPEETFVSLFIAIIFIGLGIWFLFSYLPNASSPKIARKARIISKRLSVSGSSNQHSGSTSTSYYITFEFLNGSREELSVKGKEYGLLTEGDKGILHSQGKWYQGFDR